MKNILIVGTGTIGEPLIGLLAQHKEKIEKMTDFIKYIFKNI